MQARFYRAPQTCRIVKAIPSYSRNMSLLSQAHPFFRGFPVSHSFNSEIAPLFRMLDEYASSATRALDNFTGAASSARVFQPRFDVREVDDAYELRGELPGVDSKDIEVEFTDPQTLVIRGRTERESSSGTPTATASQDSAVASTSEAAAVASANEPTNIVKDDDALSMHSDSSYHKATVEDAETGEIESTSGSPGPDTPATTTVTAATPTVPEASASNNNNINAQQDTTVAPASNSQQGQYWVTERSVGSFQRVFQFPTRIDQESVKASLKNGILSMVVPKTKSQGIRKIFVE